MTSNFYKYLIWAIVQHSVVILATFWLNESIMLKAIYAVALFTVAHLPNITLMAITFVSSVFIYSVLYSFFFYTSIVWVTIPFLILCIAHAYIGRSLVKSGIEMRVLWMHPKWN